MKLFDINNFMKILTTLLILSTSVFANTVNTTNTQVCDQFYFKKPTITTNHITICNPDFVIEYSPVTKTPIYSANILTLSSVKQAKLIGRKDTFHEDPNIPIQYRSTLNDYKKSGYDRGHMLSCEDAPNFQSQYTTFSLANMVPQDHSNNIGVWKKLENTARNYTKTEHRVYVISGPIYNNLTTSIGNDVKVPQRLFKIIILPDQNRTIVTVVNNSNSRDINITTLKELQKVVPIKF
jgi:endonuclease G